MVWALRAYRLMLWLWPARIRRERARELEDGFLACVTLARARGGRFGVWPWIVRGYVDVWAGAWLAHVSEWRDRRVGGARHRREGWAVRVLEELRGAARRLVRAPVLSGTVVLTLVLATAWATVVFSVARAVLFRSLPAERAERLVWVASVRTDRPDAPFTLAEFMDYRERARGIVLAAYGSWGGTLTTDGGAVQLQGALISANAFEVLGVRAAAGRLLRPEDDEAGAAPVVALGYGLWQREFGGRADIVGRGIRLNGEAYTVVGVLPRHFPLPLRGIEVTVPLSPDRDPRRHVRTSTNFLRFVGRLGEGTTEPAAERELTGIAQSLRAEHPEAYAAKLGVDVSGLREQVIGTFRRPILVLLGAVLLMSCAALANLMGLVLIRSNVKREEMAVRRAIGAEPSHLAQQLFAEGGLLAIAGGGTGIALAAAIVALVASGLGPDVPRLEEASMDGPVLLFALGLVGTATLVLGLTPLALALRSSLDGLRTARGRVGSTNQRVRRLLVIAEIGFATVLLNATVLLARSYSELQDVSLGFEPERVFMARVSLPANEYGTPADVTRFYDELHARLAATPGVEAAGVISIAPMTGLLSAVPFAVVGREAPDGQRISVNYRVISTDYLAAAGTGLLSGRSFTEHDRAGAPPVVLISEALADLHLAGLNPIGQRVRIDDNNVGPREVEVVGVVQNVRQTALDGAPSLDLYLPWAQAHADGVRWLINRHFWAVRTAGDPVRFDAAFRRELRGVEPEAASADAGSMYDYVDAWLEPRRFTAMLLATFTLAALLLAATGVYGIMALEVTQRRREIGLRMALGATRGSVAAWILSDVLRLSVLGLGAGWLIAAAADTTLAGLLFGVGSRDPASLALVTALLLATSLLAGWIPAVRAARLDPHASLASDA